MIPNHHVRCAPALIFLVLVLATVALAGCGSNKPEDVHIRGQITLAGEGELPNGASARISLIEHKNGDSENRIVAERTLHDLGKLPVHFNMAVGSELLGDGGDYGLSAQIMDQSGNVRWQTPVPQTLDPHKQSGPTLLMLQANENGMAAAFRHYRCNDDFRFDMAANKKQAVLHLGTRQISLATEKAGSGQGRIYADDHGDQLSVGHDKTTLAVDGESHMNCVVRGDTSTTQEGADSTPTDGTDDTTQSGQAGNQMTPPAIRKDRPHQSESAASGGKG